MAKAVQQPSPLLGQDSAVTSGSTIFELAIDAETKYPQYETEHPGQCGYRHLQREQPKPSE